MIWVDRGLPVPRGGPASRAARRGIETPRGAFVTIAAPRRTVDARVRRPRAPECAWSRPVPRHKGLVIDAYVRVSRSGSNDFTSSGPRQSLRVDDAAGKAN